MMRLRKLLVFSFLFCASVCYADDPEGLLSYPPQKILGFKGIDTRSKAPNLEDGRAVDLLNVKLSGAFDLRKRYGYALVNNTLDAIDTDPAAVTGIFDTEYSNANSWTLAFVGTRLRYDNVGTWTTVPGTVTITAGYQFQCLMALDSAICTNDNDPILKISGTPTKTVLNVSSLSSALTKAKTIIWYRNFLILGNTVEGGTERPTRFRWSNVGTIETFSDDDFVDIASFAGEEIAGFSELYGELYIFLTKSIWKASLVGGDDIFIFRKAVDNVGAIARDSIQIINFSDNRQAIVFLDDKKKVYLFDGTTVVDAGSILQPTLDNLNEARLQYAVATFDGKSYYLSATTSGESENDAIYELQTEIFEWTKHNGISANAFAQVKENTSVIKTYFGNYSSFVFWLDDPDKYNDVDGASGIVDSVGTLSSNIYTGAQAIIDSSLAEGAYTGATIRITSGTGVGQERVILSGLSTGVVVTSPFSTSPDSTSVYTIGDIDSYYYGKHYDFGDAAREKQMLGMFFVAEEASDNEVDIAHAIDFSSNAASQTVALAPSGSSLWDSALWDSGVWGSTGDKIYTVKFSGFGNYIQPKFSNDEIDESFHLYGFNLLSIGTDVKQ